MFISGLGQRRQVPTVYAGSPYGTGSVNRTDKFMSAVTASKHQERNNMTKSMKVERMQVTIYDSNEALGAAAANDLAEILDAAIAERGEASIIVATGNSQLSFIKALRAKPGVRW